MEKTIKIDELNITYKIVGEGKPFLILHGWGSKSDRWMTVAKLLSGHGFQVIIPDLPGFGQSTNPETVWNLNDYTNFVNKFVEKLGLAEFHLLGHSFGGNMAITYSLKYSEKIEKMFLVGAAAIRAETIKKKTTYGLSKIFKFLKYIPFVRRFFYRFIIKSDYPSTRGIMREIYLKTIKEDLSDKLEGVNVATSIIWGEKDDITPLKNAHQINSKIKNSTLEIVPHMGHNLHSEVPGKLSDIISKE